MTEIFEKRGVKLEQSHRSENVTTDLGAKHGKVSQKQKLGKAGLCEIIKNFDCEMEEFFLKISEQQNVIIYLF